MGYLAGRSAASNEQADTWLTAVATGLLTLIAGIQVAREFATAREQTTAWRQKLLPHAWLARRNCLAAAEEAKQFGCREWLRRNVAVLDIVETRLVTTVSMAAEIGGKEARAARKAFTMFLEGADIVVKATDPRLGYTTEQMTQARDDAGAKYAEVAQALEVITGQIAVAAGARPSAIQQDP
jgi:hypothetical protein